MIKQLWVFFRVPDFFPLAITSEFGLGPRAKKIKKTKQFRKKVAREPEFLSTIVVDLKVIFRVETTIAAIVANTTCEATTIRS